MEITHTAFYAMVSDTTVGDFVSSVAITSLTDGKRDRIRFYKPGNARSRIRESVIYKGVTFGRVKHECGEENLSISIGSRRADPRI